MLGLIFRLLAGIFRNCRFMDAESSGLLYCTARAGSGTGVLFHDPLADGTTSVMTLAQAGNTSINLKADLTHVQYADGSAITGQTTFTRVGGAAGTVANIMLALLARTVLTTSENSVTVHITKPGYGAAVDAMADLRVWCRA